MRIEGAEEFDIEADAGLVLGQAQPMTAEAFDHGKLQRADLGRQRIGAQAARGAEVVLLAANGDAGEGVHDVAVGVIAQAEIENDLARGRQVAGVPQPLHPGRVAGADVIEGGG